MAKKRKFYFDNDAITKAVLDFQETGDIEPVYEYTDQIVQLVKGIINTHKIYVWWDDFNELVQEGMLAIYSAISRFDPEKGTAFNYMSIVVKQHLINWTRSRNKKKWAAPVEYDDELYVSEDSTLADFDEHIIFEEIFSEVEVPHNLAESYDAITNCIQTLKIYNKRDISRHLVRSGYDKEKIKKVFEILEKKHG